MENIYGAKTTHYTYPHSAKLHISKDGWRYAANLNRIVEKNNAANMRVWKYAQIQDAVLYTQRVKSV